MTEERTITAAVVTFGEKGNGSELPALLEVSQENGIAVDIIIGDAAYSGKENLKLAGGQEIKIVSKLNPLLNKVSGNKKIHLITTRMQECLYVPPGTWLS